MLAGVHGWRRAIVAVVVVIAYATLPLDSDLGVVFAGALIAVVALGFIPIALNTYREIIEAEHPVRIAVRDSATMATLLVTAFATAYFLLAVEYDQMHGLETKLDAVYFTIVTAATVGFGDITPTGQAARAVVSVNILVTLVIAGAAFRIVAAATRQRTNIGDRS
jgi:voltage-gated potassium channel